MSSSYLTITGNALLSPLIDLWSTFVETMPGILIALVVAIVGYVVAAAFGLLFNRVLEATRIDQHLKKAGLSHSIGFISIANLGGALLKWYIFALFLVKATSFLRLGVLSDQLIKLAGWLPNLFASLIIILVGLVISDMIADRMLHAKRRGVRLFSSIVRWSVILFTVLIAIEHIGIRVDLAANAVLVLIGGVALGLGIAIGIGFGFALKDEAKAILKHIKKNW